MGDAIQFVLDGRLRTIRGLDPNTTVLEWLRGPERRSGTKEGCAEGDCGACTVAVAETDGAGTTHWRAVNACIQPIATLHGRWLATVESLCGSDDALHPVQQAMVETHASQCGYCTPGFVMSLFALRHDPAPATAEATLRALAGNLCRCTGYRPILAAAGRMRETAPGPDRFDAEVPAVAALLAASCGDAELGYDADGRRWHAPRTLAALDRVLAARPTATLVAGATDLGLEITKRHRRFDDLVFLGGVDELRGVRRGAGALDLGAAVTWADAHAPLAAAWPTLDEFVARFAGLQIRNVATLGGNIANASPIGDGSPLFLALDATLLLRRDGVQRALPLREFFLGYRRTALQPGEIVERIVVPLPTPSTRFAAWKVAKRYDSDISAVCGCFRVELDARGRIAEAAIAFGGMAAVPLRVPDAEAAVVGRDLDDATAEAGARAIASVLAPIDDLRASAGYRRDVAGALWRRAVAAFATGKAARHG
ncbi:MAG: xanthine dehydrogenase small subunit [Alphaproteobacteria bacterium]|nr:xanthine dehydrogenase small subunit [Alphaproteobacteria bacterium]